MQSKLHKTCETRRKKGKLVPIYENSASFACFAFISPTFGQIIHYFAQSCDCMITAFKNSVAELTTLKGFVASLQNL